MKQLLLVTGILAGLTGNTFGQQVLLNNLWNSGNCIATNNGLVFLGCNTLFDGWTNNLGVNVYGGPAPGQLTFMGTYTAATDPKGYTGYDLGTFALGPYNLAVTVPGLFCGACCGWIKLEIWYDGVGGLFPSYDAAVAGGGLVGTVLFLNRVSNPCALPPEPAHPLESMPSVVLQAVPPTIYQQPQSQAVFRGSNASFNVGANGPFLNYQWRFFQAAIAGATNNALVLTNVQCCKEGLYSVVVSNAGGVALSSPAQLTVLGPPLITAQPQGAVGLWGGAAQFEVAAEAYPAPSYRWLKNDFPIAGATTAVLTLTNLEFTDAASYSVVVTNRYGATRSAAAQLVVVPAGIGLGLPPFLTITGTVGKTLGIQVTSEITQSNSWITLTSLMLLTPVQEWVDPSPGAGWAPKRFYRVVPVP